MDRIIKKTHPKLFDKAIGYIQDSLAELPWLDHIFGRAERLVTEVEGKRIYLPNVYIGKDEYEQVTPDTQDLGNHAFFLLNDPHTITLVHGSRAITKCPYSLIVWVDVRTIDFDDERNTESIKSQVLAQLNNTWMRQGSYTVERIYEKAENVYEGFTLDEIDNQYLMSPYWGMRITGVLTIEDDCAS